MRQSLFAAAALALLAILAPPPALADSPTLRIQVSDRQGENNVDLTLGGGFVAGLMRAFAPAHLDCDGDHDPALRALMAQLERDGDGARGSARAEDGDLVRAHRHDGLLELEITGEDGDDAELTLPWTLAQCFFTGGELPTRELARALERGELRIEAHDADDDVRITLE